MNDDVKLQDTPEGKGSKLAELMSKLTRPLNNGGLSVMSTTFTLGGIKIFLGRDESGFPHLLLPQKSHQKNQIPPIAAMVSARNRDWANDDGSIQPYLDLVCESASADKLFAAMSLDICEKLDSKVVPDTENLVSVVSDQVAHWRQILEAISVVEASASEKIGMIGELLTLEALYGKHGSKAYDSWYGQEKARHDFEFETQAFEVKASSRTSGVYCTVHGLNQLAYSIGTTLFLVHYQLEWSADGDSISKIINRLEQIGLSKAKVQSKLGSHWPALGEMPKWFSDYEFKIIACRKYEVDSHFPVVSQSTLGDKVSSKISNMQYTLNLTDQSTLGVSSEVLSIQEVVTFD